MNQDNIGKFILELRNEKGWTQEDLANRIPITRQAVSRWEQGKSIPDSSTLVILSEIFGVSINELLSGRRIPKKEIVKESEKIALEIIDKNISMKKKIKRILISFISLFFIGIIGFLCYYFFATYNSVKVYSIGGKSKNFYLQDGVLISTKQKLFFKLGELVYSDKIEIDDIKMYFYKDGKEKRLYNSNSFGELIIENYGYEEYFYFDDLEDILKGIRMDIYYDNKVESVELDFLMILSNNKFVFDKRKIDVNNNENKTSESEEDILKFMIKNGIYKDDYYEYKIENKTFKYYDEAEQIILERSSLEYVEVWLKEINKEYLLYNHRFGYNLTNKKILSINNLNSDEDKTLYDRFYNYLDKYILSKSN